ncbi:MAG: hypothetical protein H6620_09860 [Halobacteriovoraceae bacterium]|nr:hypothetical protein [Halobacteriovoraceae bacterium]
MESVLLEEVKLKKIVKVTVLIQCVLISSYIIILFLKPHNYPILAQKFGWLALIISFGLSRYYIFHGKKLENVKNFSEEEKESKKKEYFLYFFFLYPLWAIAIIATRYFSS